MKNYALILPLFALCLTVQICSADSSANSSIPLSQAVAGAGSLVVFTPQKISGLHTDGTPAYMQEVNYGESAAKLGCTLTYNTVRNIDLMNMIPGVDAVVPQGTKLEWSTDDVDYDRYISFKQDDGKIMQALRLVFFGDGSALTNVLCTISTASPQPTLTIKDFEEAMGGAMTLVPAKR